VLQERSYGTPGTTRVKVICQGQDLELIDPELKSRYHSKVGMILYSTKYSRSDIFNLVRELCTFVDGATMGTYLEMLIGLNLS
jgi:hypothetical protein